MKQKDNFDIRFEAAKRQRDAVEDDLKELYIFLFNGREREFDTTRSKWTDPTEIYDSSSEVANLEFTGDLFSYATPESQKWVEFEVGTAIPEDQVEDAKEIVEQREDRIDLAIRTSNYYDVGPTVFQEAGIGTIGAMVERPHLNRKIEVEPVPISQLYFTVGAQGVEDRFRKKLCFSRDIPILFPDFKPSRNLKVKLDKPDATVWVCWGWWRDYSDLAFPRWVHMAKIEGEVAVEEQVIGPEGACPLLIGRFNPIPNVPYGRGPGWMMLPEIRTINALREIVLNKMETSVDPAIIYTRDGLLDLTEGLEAGMAYPAMPGTAQEIRELGLEGNLDYGLFTLDELVKTIRRGFFRQEDQQGKTPPSASQFLGEEQKSIRMMGRPAASVFNEFVKPLIARVEFLEVEAGNLEEQILLNDQAISVTPISPLVRAQAREQVIQAEGLMQTAFNYLGPEQGPLVIDGPVTMRRMKDRLGDEIVRFRENEEIAQIIEAQQSAQST